MCVTLHVSPPYKRVCWAVQTNDTSDASVAFSIRTVCNCSPTLGSNAQSMKFYEAF